MRMVATKSVLVIFIYLLSQPLRADEAPTVGSYSVSLRKSPLFESETLGLSSIWGPALPTGNEFVIAKSYGRWIYGSPKPLPRMKAKDFAPQGWIYNRSLLPAGDSSTRSREANESYFSAEAQLDAGQKKWGEEFNRQNLLHLKFLNSLVLSRNTLAAFIRFDEATSAQSFLDHWPNLVSEAHAADTNLGFSGANLNFLAEASQTARKSRAAQKKKSDSLVLQPYVLPAPTILDKEIVLGRLFASRRLEFPGLSHEEVDGHLYLRALVTRSLEACPDLVRNEWSKRPWNIFHFRTLRDRPRGENLWVQFEAPGGLFLVSDQVLRHATNEAELAFALIRPFVLSMRAGKIDWSLANTSLDDLSKSESDVLEKIKQTYSTKLNPKLDVADDIYADFVASQCIASAGYRYDAGLNYVSRLRSSREADWASWFVATSTGVDYRLEELGKAVSKGVLDGSLKKSETLNKKRFEAAAKLWNL